MIFLLVRHAFNSVISKKRFRNSGGSSKVEGCGNSDSYMSWRTARAIALSSARFGSRLSFRQINFLWREEKYCMNISYKCTAVTKFCISLVRIKLNWLEVSSFTVTSLCCRQSLLCLIVFSVTRCMIWTQSSPDLGHLNLRHLPPE